MMMTMMPVQQPTLSYPRAANIQQPARPVVAPLTLAASSALAAPQRAASVAAVAAVVAPQQTASAQPLPLRRDELVAMPVAFAAAVGAGSSSSNSSSGSNAEVRSVRRILCYGDSLTAGFAANGQQFEPYGRAMAERLAGAGTACEVAVCGLSGKTAREMVATSSTSLADIVGNRGKGLVRALEEDGPFDLVLIMAGTNDMGHGAQPETILQDLQRLHGLCHERGVPTVALAPPPAPVAGSAREQMRQRFTAKLRALSQGMERMVACVDPADIVPASALGLWEQDGLHFTPAGSRQFGAGLASLALELSGNSSNSSSSSSSRPCSLPHNPTSARQSRPLPSLAAQPLVAEPLVAATWRPSTQMPPQHPPAPRQPPLDSHRQLPSRQRRLLQRRWPPMLRQRCRCCRCRPAGAKGLLHRRRPVRLMLLVAH
mmetsp:Transcript_128557/g.333271  ORF Transcript_128557/g.333271 Transcript_128557/m.333271 type:complete len:430 (+) Transcript_128557:83-1372(+)